MRCLYGSNAGLSPHLGRLCLSFEMGAIVCRAMCPFTHPLSSWVLLFAIAALIHGMTRKMGHEVPA